LPAAQYKGRSSKVTAPSDSICALQLASPEKPRRGIFLLCYLRGPAGIIVALAEQIG